MLLNDLKNIKVYTKSGRYLGRVLEIEIDPTTQFIISYQVGHWPKLPGLWKNCLLIGREQVLSITPRALVVDDSVELKNVESATVSTGG